MPTSAVKCRLLLGAMMTALGLSAERADAQELRGTVMMSNGTTPASGVVAVLLHPTRDDSIMARAISTERGRFVLKTSPVTGARLRLLRIGFEPMYAGDFTLSAGETRDVSVTLNDVRIRLAAVDVKAASRCELRPDGAQLVSQLFLQARTALIASTTPLVGNTSATQFFSYRRRQDRRGMLMSPIQRTTQSGATLRPFASLSVDSLTRVGYVVSDGLELSDGGTYYAPDANVLLSDTFLAHHCLQLVQGKDSLAGSIGIGFRPAGDLKRLVDVRGTLWLDRATSELQFLDYSYEGLPDYLRDAGLGGRVEYAQLSNGSWFVNNWSIRMPVLAVVNVARVGSLARSAVSDRVTTAGQLIEGGQVQSIRVDDQVLYLNTNAARAGQTQQDIDEERASIAAALKSLEGAPSGTIVRVDSSTAPSVCTEKVSPERKGAVKGRVLDEFRKGVADQDVKAEWKEQFEMTSLGLRWRNSALRTLSADDGAYRICGLPSDRPVNLSVLLSRNLWTRPSTVRLSDDSPVATLDLPLSRSAVRAVAQSVSTGVELVSANSRGDATAELLITNVAGQPVPYAVVTLSGGVTRVADVAGTVQFNHPGKDTVQVVVKRVGFESYDGSIVRRSAALPFTVALLPSSHSIASVNARDNSAYASLEQSGFYSRMQDGQRGGNVGEFMAPEQLDPRNMMQLSQHLSASRYAKVERVGTSLVVRGRAGCVMTFIVDGRRIDNLFQGKSKERGNTDTVDDLVKGSGVAAIEVYPTGASVPSSLQSLTGGGSCGVVAVWTKQ